MTLLGKVFVGIVFCLSLIFFFVSLMVNATHIKYRDLVEDKSNGLKVQLSREQAKSNELTQLVAKLKDAQALEQLARRSALSALQTQLERLSSDVAEKEKQLAEAQSQLTKLVVTEQQTQQELAARTTENEDLRKRLVQAREDRNAQYQKFVKSYNDFLQIQGEKKTLREAADALAQKSSAAEAKLNQIGLTPESKIDGPPPVNGVVNAVKDNLVEVSIGLDDGVRVGHKLDVYRNGQYIGRINITRSVDDKAIGEVLPSYSKGFILKGDRVDSSLMYVKSSAPQQ